jgi:Fe-S-cluster containining protein
MKKVNALRRSRLRLAVHGRPDRLDDINLARERAWGAEPLGWKRNIMANARKACAACTGMCCTAFSVNFPTDSQKQGELIDSATKDLDRVMERIDKLQELAFFHGVRNYPPPVPISLLREKARALAYAEGIIFNLENLIPIGVHLGQTIYRCAKFSLEQQRCTDYANRPEMCRNYICGTAARFGAPPAKEVMTAGTKSLVNVVTKMVLKGPNRMRSDMSWKKERPRKMKFYPGECLAKEDPQPELKQAE